MITNTPIIEYNRRGGKRGLGEIILQSQFPTALQLEAIRRLPGAKWHATSQEWTFSPSGLVALTLRQFFPDAIIKGDLQRLIMLFQKRGQTCQK